MIEFLVDNIYVRFGGQLFRQMVGIPMGTNCAPLLADLLLYSYENEFLDKLIKEGKGKLARKFYLSYHYIDDLFSLKFFLPHPKSGLLLPLQPHLLHHLKVLLSLYTLCNSLSLHCHYMHLVIFSSDDEYKRVNQINKVVCT